MFSKKYSNLPFSSIQRHFFRNAQIRKFNNILFQFTDNIQWPVEKNQIKKQSFGNDMGLVNNLDGISYCEEYKREIC